MITFIPLTGFLGAGKTTTMTEAAAALEEQGRRVAVITNDQGADLVDTKLARSKLDRVAEVTGGCFCCRFEDLVGAIVALVSRNGVDTVLAEAVGSCTDLQATVVRPLRQYYSEMMVVAPLTTVVDPLRWLAFDRANQRGDPESDLSYLFRQQLNEADVIAVNKLDTVTPERAAELLARLRVDHPNASIVGYSARTGDRFPLLLESWARSPSNAAVKLGIEYDRYAAAEAQLAWLNQEMDLRAEAGSFDPTAWGRRVLEHLSEWAQTSGAVIGHAKLIVETTARDDFAKLSLTVAGADPTLDRAADSTATGRAVFNARIACEPDELDRAVTEAVAGANRALEVSSSAGPPVSFKPSYPRPVHRLEPADA